MAEQKPKVEPAPEPAPEPVRLKAAIEWSGELAIGEARYPVVNGVVEVPAWHVENAYQAGFRPEAVG
jgi:hypothetical protein